MLVHVQRLSFSCIFFKNLLYKTQTTPFCAYFSVPPLVIIKPEKVMVYVNQSARFECLADGNPSPNITWTPSHGEVTGNVLHFEAVEDRDEGWYNCSADNGVGPAVNASAYLRVFSK